MSSDDESPLDCGGAPYDEDRTSAAIELASLVTLPHGWTNAEARANPLDRQWHKPRLDWMESERIGGEAGQDTYLVRQAVLVWEVYLHAPWAIDCRKGAAWALLLYGVWTHRFIPRGGPADTVLNPDIRFFDQLAEDGGLGALIALLQAAFTSGE